jgi:hypothetical protein
VEVLFLYGLGEKLRCEAVAGTTSEESEEV